MEASAGVYPVVAGEGFTVPVGWRTQPVAPSWIAKFLTRRGWRSEGVELGESEARFADGSDVGPLPYPPIMLAGMAPVGALPVIGVARMPSDFLTFRRDRISLKVVVTGIAEDPWAQQWATYMLDREGNRPAPFGTAVIQDEAPGVTLGNDDFVVDATWWIDGKTVPPGGIPEPMSPAGELAGLAQAA